MVTANKRLKDLKIVRRNFNSESLKYAKVRQETRDREIYDDFHFIW